MKIEINGGKSNAEEQRYDYKNPENAAAERVS